MHVVKNKFSTFDMVEQFSMIKYTTTYFIQSSVEENLDCF